MKRPNLPDPPEHLSDAMKEWWIHVVGTYRLEQHHLHLLRGACEARDRAEQAREILAKEGLTFLDRFSQLRPRPEVAIEQASMIRFARLVRELRLDDDPPPDPRPPRLGRKD